MTVISGTEVPNVDAGFWSPGLYHEVEMIETPSMFISVGTDAVRILLKQPRQCTCGRMVAFLTNRFGRTRCVECDRTSQKG